jgi:hypothetical protein
MSVQGIHDVFLAEGSINGDRFQFFIRNYLLPVMMPFNGINPLSSPDLYPLEPVFGKVKAILKENNSIFQFKQLYLPWLSLW